MRLPITLVTAFLALTAQAQADPRYDALVREAYALYQQKQFSESAARYSAAFEALGWKGYSEDRYNAACSWALAGMPDSAFFNLQRITEKLAYADLKQISGDPDLASLHSDKRWAPLLDQVEANRTRLEKNLDRDLAARLDSIHERDQAYRQITHAVEEQFGRDSPEMREHVRRMIATDSTNLIAVRGILDERGWLGEDVVGRTGNSALFLVMQHADLATQEHYLPMMREAVRKGNARGADLALLEDRVLMRQGKRQIYGSQVGRFPDTGEFYLSPLDDPERVDKRRAEVGLQPLAEYLMHWDLKWDPRAYEAALPALEERIKAMRR